ncbi:hypothetical protein DC364_22385, partial [Vibrio vulnificus]|uniref:hypothetical protein n=1 Tax=Vibrio vulnificus TaxID=672 RepID=UPI000D51F4FA
QLYRLSPETRPAGWENGPVWVRCNHSTDWDSYLDVLIDYRQLPDGLLWNGSANALGISNAWLNFGYLFHAQHNQVQLHKGSVYPDLTKFFPSERYERQWMPFIESHSFNVKDVAHPYVLETLAIDDSTYGNRMAIRDGKGRYYANDNGTLNVVEGALHRFRCFGDGGYIDVMVNVDAIKAFSHLPTLLWNRNDPWILFTANEGCNSGSRLLTLSFDFPMIDVNESKLTTQTIMEVGKSVKSAEVILGDNLAVDDLYIQVFTKSPSDFNDSIWLCTKDKTVGTWAGVASTTEPTEIEVTGTQSGQLVTVKMVIDWTQIETSGVLINGVPSAAPLALKEDNAGRDQAAKAVTKHEESFHFAQWLDPSARNHAGWNSFASFLALQVKGFHLGNTKDGVIYGIGIITKNSVQYGTGVSIFDNEKRIVASGRVDMANPDGETVFELMPVGDGPKGKLWLDMTQMEDGTVENRNQPRLLLNPEYVEIRAIPDMVNPAPDTRVNQYVRNAVRLACMGSSITWGSGYVGQSSFVGVIEDYLRQTCATTLLGYDLASMTRLSESMQYKGAVGMMEGAGKKTEANLHGDEVSLAICKERGNIHAAVVEMWVNGALHTRFSTYNEEPYQENVAKSFTGDGSIRSWDLGQAFTFNHRVTKDGATLTGGIYNGGYGGSWPDGWEYMVVRKVSESDSEHKVTHWLTFKTAPAASSQIQCTFDYGESIKPMRSTVGNTGKELGTPLESTYGDGNVAYDPANPVGLSSGLDFRHSDDRAVVTASFDAVKDLKVELKIIGSDPRVTNPGEPRLYLGFVTNKMHHVMNAGIGGFKASSFDEPYENLKSHYKVSQWKPTHITMESCTNDDWGTNEYVCWHDVTMSQDQLFNIDSLLWVQAINKNPDLSYRVSDSRIGYEDIGPFHVTLKSDTTQIGDIQPGDIVSFGLWKGDNRTVVSRVVTNWTVATRKIEWGPELRLDEFGWKMDDLTDIEVVQVRSLVKWKNNVEKVLDYL